MKQKRNIRGITLIALVITIIVLLILAGISIATLTGENGILAQTQNAKKNSEQAELEEQVNLANVEYEAQIYKVNDLEYYLRKIDSATVEKLAEDTWYVTRKDVAVTVYSNGDIITGKVNIWDGVSIEVPEFKDFNWYIYNGAQMKFFADFVNNANTLTEEQKTLVAQEGYNESDITITEDTTVYLMADLDLGARQTNGTLTTGTAWTPIGTTSELKFIGTFEGNNHSISGVYIDRTETFSGIFGNSNTIVNLSIKNSYIKGASCTGSIVGILRTGKIENCHNINTTVILREGEYYAVGGVVANARGTVEGCSNSGIIEGNGVDSEATECGGIVGLAYYDVNNCSNTGTVRGKGYAVGGITGFAVASSTTYNCSNTGTVRGKGYAVGGITGVAGASSTTYNCSNKGTVTGQGERVGGIIGTVNRANTIYNCSNTGTVTGQGEYVGGIVGNLAYYNNATNSKVENCYNAGNVNGTVDVGGIVGSVGGSSGQGTVTKCYSKGKITGTTGVGAIIGRQRNTTGLNTLNHLYYLNTVGIGAINGIDDESNHIMSTTENLNSYEQFLAWIEKQQ